MINCFQTYLAAVKTSLSPALTALRCVGNDTFSAIKLRASTILSPATLVAMREITAARHTSNTGERTLPRLPKSRRTKARALPAVMKRDVSVKRNPS
jgi:hypothetical protein